MQISEILEKIKYICFDVKWYAGVRPTDKEIINVNILTLKPDYINSDGISSYMNITTQMQKDGDRHMCVHQFWVGLESLTFNEKNEIDMDRKDIEKALNILEEKLKFPSGSILHAWRKANKIKFQVKQV